VIEVRYRNAFGNNLFQYAIGRLLAEERGVGMVCSQATRRMTGGQVGLPQVLDAFVDLPQTLPGPSYLHPQTRFVLGERGDWNGQGFDRAALRADSRQQRIVLDGFFQIADWYAPHVDRLRKWFAMRPQDLPCPAPDDVAIHIRRGDYWRHGGVLDASWYADRLDQMNPGKVVVFGVGIDEQIRTALKPWNPVYSTGDVLSDFALMQRFERIILANSSFSWWAALLSHAQVWHPLPVRFLWSPEFGAPNLVPKLDRWHVVKSVPVTLWRPFRPHPKRMAAMPPPLQPELEPLVNWVAQQVEPFGIEELLSYADGASAPQVKLQLAALVKRRILTTSTKDRHSLQAVGVLRAPPRKA